MEDPQITLSLDPDTAVAVLLALEHYKMSAVAPLDRSKRQLLVNEYRCAVQNQLCNSVPVDSL